MAGLAYEVGAVDDPAEAAADAMAHRALSALNDAHGVQTVRALTAVRRSSTVGSDGVGAAGGVVTGRVATALRRLQGAGRSLPATVREPMEQAFGADFRAVRVHSGPGAAELSRDLGARAFTLGSDIVLGEDATADAQPSVLAHELAHVVQDGAAGGPLHRLRAVRRLVGFEVELAVPTYRRENHQPVPRIGRGPVGDPALTTLLTGGIEYKEEMGNVPVAGAGNIRLTADHEGGMQNAGQVFFDAVETAFPDQTEDIEHTSLSNLEYSTPALDELAPGSDARYLAMAKKIDEHAASILDPRPMTTMRPIANAMLFTSGLPRQQLEAWLGNTPERPTVMAAYTKLQQHVRWFMYVQATVGILPAGLIKLYGSQAEGLPETEGRGDAPAALKDAATAVAAVSKTFMGMDELYTGGLELKTGQALQVGGVLTMAASYAIGRTMLQTSAIGDSEKNAVQLFGKLATNAGVATALSPKLRERFAGKEKTDPAVKALITAAAKVIHTLPQTNVAYWTKPPYRARLVDRGGALYGTGDKSPWLETASLIADWLAGRDTVKVARPGVEGQLAKPDAAPAALAAFPQSLQQGVPLELRWIMEFPDGPGKLWPVFQQVLKEVRAANTDQLENAARQKILSKV